MSSPVGKGIIGELLVKVQVKLYLDKNVYHLINNVTIPTEDGTTQIDHIIVSQYGLFVIETKNYKGWIFGSEKQKMWTQQIFKTKNKFQNPLHQNYKHTRTLESLLDLESGEAYSIVAFVGDSTFKTEMPQNVFKGAGWVDYIKTFTQEIYTVRQVAQLYLDIENNRLSKTWKTQREHVAHVKELHSQEK